MRTLWIYNWFLTALIGQAAPASGLTLAWNASTARNIVGYRVYYGASSRVYTNLVSVGNVTNATVSGLIPGVTYYFAATAFDAAGLESVYSTEISYQIPRNQAIITVSNLVQVYDGGPKTVLANTLPAGLPVSLTYNGSLTAPTNAGSYQVVAAVTDPNYRTTVTNTLLVAKAPATLTLSWLNQTYDGTARLALGASSPPGLELALTYNGSAIAPRNAGVYTVVGTITDPNYTGAVTNNLVIAKAIATVTLSGLNQAFDGTPRPVQGNSVPAGLALTFTYNGSGNAPLNAGSYTVIGTVIDPNYLGGATNTLVVAKGSATVALNLLNQTYDGTPKSAVASSSPPGLAVTLTYNGTAGPPVNVGSYTVVGTISDANYNGAATNTLVIGKGQAGVILSQLNQTFDGTPRAVMASTSPAGLTIGLTYNGSATVPANAGNYTVVATVNDSNYNGTVTNTLVVARAQATVTLTQLNQTYDGTPKPVPASSSPIGLAITLTYNGNTQAPVNAGNYAVVGTINDSNYCGGVSNSLVIVKARASVLIGNLTQLYDGTPKAVVVTTVPTNLSVSVTYNGQLQTPTKAGAYTVVATISDANYSGSATGTLSITRGKPRPPRQAGSAIANLQVPNPKCIALGWSPVPSSIVIEESSDLNSWTVIAELDGLSGQWVLLQEPGAHFFRALRPMAEGNDSVPLVIRQY